MAKEPRYELLELVDEKYLTQLIRSFCKALSVVGGIVKNPESGGDIPEEPSKFCDWRLIPVVGFDKNGRELFGGSEFCKAVRTLDRGNTTCMKGDLAFAKTAFHECKAQRYNCPSAYLVVVKRS